MNIGYPMYKNQIARFLINCGCRDLVFNDENWRVDFSMNGVKLHCYFDDGIDCMYFENCKVFYAPLDWSVKCFREFESRLKDINEVNF